MTSYTVIQNSTGGSLSGVLPVAQLPAEEVDRLFDLVMAAVEGAA